MKTFSKIQEDASNEVVFTKNQEVKLMIITNYIEWFTTNDEERDEMIENAELYIKEDHVDEIGQSFPEINTDRTNLD